MPIPTSTNLTWNSTCTNRADSTDFVATAIANASTVLRAGGNVLAVQAINATTTSSDFLFSTELIGSGGAADPRVSASAVPYTGPVTLRSTARVKARVLGSEWSALNEAVYAVGPVPMMRAVADVTRPRQIHTIASLNPIMVDGTGMCGGCRVMVGGKMQFACVDGPEFDAHQVNFAELADRLTAYRDQERNSRERAQTNHECKLVEAEKAVR